MDNYETKINIKTNEFWNNIHKDNNHNLNNYLLPNSIFTLQRFVLYETKTRFYLVGSNKIKNRFRLIKIDRTDENDVVISEDPTEYNKEQIQDLLTMIGNANKEGLSLVCSAYGLLGFIKFLHGYYIILITKKRKVGVIGTHYIYGIDDITYVYVPTTIPKTNSPEFSDETRYKGLFLGLDLTKDFYFSYSYDITRTLQFNMTRYVHSPIPTTIQKDQNSKFIKLYYNQKFAWNQFLLEPLITQVSSWCWIQPIIHGFYVQEKIDVFGKGLDLILIARRSRYYAGARFLKRGLNENGQVANDIESEQILQEPLTGTSKEAHYTSFVQIRGSIPLYWEQDNNIITPKPPIQIQRVDPFFGATIMHFQDLFKRYGAPVIILNLVKSNEKKPRESILRDEFTHCIECLNEMLPDQYKIHYQPWDFHQAAKSKDQDHMAYLDNFAIESVKKTGIFNSKPLFYNNVLNESLNSSTGFGASGHSNYIHLHGSEQIGVIRTNCIDSLDRTNAAQFCIGKVALGYQLYAMGFIDACNIDFNSGLVQILVNMYEACGNQIALQYGGSELANTIKTYTKHSLSSQSRDIVAAIKRYISNSFIDVDKQHAINLFLGYYVPSKAKENIPLWNMETDHYLHNKKQQHLPLLSNTPWWEDPVKEFNKTSLLYNYSTKASLFNLMKSKKKEKEDNFFKPYTLFFYDNFFGNHFNNAIQMLESPFSVPGQQNSNQGQINTSNEIKKEDQGNSLNQTLNDLEAYTDSEEDSDSEDEENLNKYDIKKWVISITKRSRKKQARKRSIASFIEKTKALKNAAKSDLVEFQPLRNFGISLETSKYDKTLFENYLNYDHFINPFEYNHQDIYSLKYYREYIKFTKYSMNNFHSYSKSNSGNPLGSVNISGGDPVSSGNSLNSSATMMINPHVTTANGNPLGVSYNSMTYRGEDNAHFYFTPPPPVLPSKQHQQLQQQIEQQQLQQQLQKQSFNTISSYDKHFQDITKHDLKSFYYESYLQSHNTQSEYQVNQTNIDIYQNYINLMINLKPEFVFFFWDFWCYILRDYTSISRN
ncbi:putative sac domain-containing inositol phosphatase [Tieghemostelium lacteum]|uniref:Putative sac domain-containing inositol phosphatase n=1 Tax=Tieghemostelium lacteum TaxID=361077 RepID=A0A151Z9K1_TIELA|nr:putative sac domain-containing inositol phosphatase [Tieghemostelium lacteum]|eukprot:KYQ90630.1 putative sac domain-containing inositol phosphatase [Tieghemostelium lacteum]